MHVARPRKRLILQSTRWALTKVGNYFRASRICWIICGGEGDRGGKSGHGVFSLSSWIQQSSRSHLQAVCKGELLASGGSTMKLCRKMKRDPSAHVTTF